jgi:hypothetical protein
MPQTKIKLIMDSGAYSAWKLGKPIDRDKYHDFLLANMDWIETAIALDEINPNDPEAAARASFDNWTAANKRGLITMPVFHARESFDWLDRYLDAGCKYVGISASSLRGGSKADDWYAMVWDHIGNQDGLPPVKTHAFGEGREAPLQRFPWFSADSTSWIYKSQRSGLIRMGKHTISQRNDGLNERNAQDLGSLDEEDRLVFDEHLLLHGVDPAGMHKDDEEGFVRATCLRSYLAAKHYMAMRDRISLRCPIRHKRANLFGGHREAPAINIPDLRFILVIGDNLKAWVPFVMAGCIHGLISYHYLARAERLQTLTKAFVYDPIGVMQSTAPMQRYYNLMKDYIKC